MSDNEVAGSDFGSFDDELNCDDEKALNIDTHGFDPKDFVDTILKKYNLPALLEKKSQLSNEVKTLDSDMQMLVYENYNKFISATDTIRSMKTSVEGMEDEMHRLSESVERISSTSDRINKSLSRRRTTIERLNNQRSLLNRLEYVFDLPDRLARTIDLGAYSEAVKTYKLCAPVLQHPKHRTQPTFASVREACEDKLVGLRKTLRARMTAEETAFRDVSDCVKLLLDLDESEGDLQMTYINCRETRLLERLEGLRVKHGSQGEEPGGVDDPSFEDSPCSSLRELAGDIEGFLTEWGEFVESFLTIFVLPLESQQQKVAENVSEADANIYQQRMVQARSELVRISRGLIDEFMGVVRRGVASRACSILIAPQEETTPSVSDTQDAHEVAYGVVDFLTQLSTGAGRLHRLLPPLELGDRVQAFIEDILAEAIDGVFKRLSHEFTISLDAVHAKSKVLGKKAAQIRFGISEAQECPSDNDMGGVEMLGELARELVDAAQTCGIEWEESVNKTLQMLSPLRSMANSDLKRYDAVACQFVSERLGDVLRELLEKLHDSAEPSLLVVPEDSIDVLMDAELARIFQSTTLGRIMEKVVLWQGHSGESLTASMIMEDHTDVAQDLLVAVVKTEAAAIEPMIQESIQSMTLEEESESADSHVSPSIISVARALQVFAVILLGVCGGESVPSVETLATLSEESLDDCVRRLRDVGGAVGSIQMRVANIFEEKVDLFAPVKWEPLSITAAVVKLVLKSLLEYVRGETFSSARLSRAMLDGAYLRLAFAAVLASSPQMTASMHSLLDQIALNAKDRCKSISMLEEGLLSAALRSVGPPLRYTSFISTRNR
eukprot:Rmarinus@m.17249